MVKKITVLLLLSLFGFPNQIFSICFGPPEVQYDTLPDSRIEAKFNYLDNPMNNFTDTLSRRFVYDWIHELYDSNAYVFHGKIIKAEFSEDTVVNEVDTLLGCTDIAVELKAGDSTLLREHKTTLQIRERFKGTYSSDTVEIIEYLIYPFICNENAYYPKNPYSSLLDNDFFFFGETLDSFPSTGPRPNFYCNEKAGFFIDSADLVEKFGLIDLVNWKISRERYPSGYPGMKIEKDSIIWAFENYTGLLESESFQFKKRNKIQMSENFSILGVVPGGMYMLNGQKVNKTVRFLRVKKN